MRCPACGHKSLPDRDGLLRCQSRTCGGLFDPSEISSGRVEGGTHGDRPDERAIRNESGGDKDGYAIKSHRKLKGGLE